LYLSARGVDCCCYACAHAFLFNPGYVVLLAVKSNDMMLAIYLSSLIRSVLALHKLIDNKETRMWHEKEAQTSKVS
jgi:hypothetical protein